MSTVEVKSQDITKTCTQVQLSLSNVQINGTDAYVNATLLDADSNLYRRKISTWIVQRILLGDLRMMHI